ncbi:hypothetical protein PLICRDRAFT_43245 [Plicaturopsis crispa FD-325 SS-3]|nr:hypothetical protein PLICRDRAFT_43245 [Plicaturopsis crispa FD-325 SS-3]
MPEKLTLYTAKICPFAHRVELALEEVGAKHTKYPVDLYDKPSWFPKVNALGKVPVITYGGPEAPPEDPSPEAERITESSILVEFIADLYPSSPLRPADAVGRAKARLFIDVVSNKFLPAYGAVVVQGKPEAIFPGVEALQDLLPADKPFALGDTFTIADVSALPLIARLEVALVNDAGAFAVGEGPKLLKTLSEDPKYARFWRWFQALKARQSFKATFDEAYLNDVYVKKLVELRK